MSISTHVRLSFFTQVHLETFFYAWARTSLNHTCKFQWAWNTSKMECWFKIYARWPALKLHTKVRVIMTCQWAICKYCLMFFLLTWKQILRVLFSFRHHHHHYYPPSLSFALTSHTSRMTPGISSRHLQLIFLLTASARWQDAYLLPLNADENANKNNNDIGKNEEAEGDRMRETRWVAHFPFVSVYQAKKIILYCPAPCVDEPLGSQWHTASWTTLRISQRPNISPSAQVEISMTSVPHSHIPHPRTSYWPLNCVFHAQSTSSPRQDQPHIWFYANTRWRDPYYCPWW